MPRWVLQARYCSENNRAQLQPRASARNRSGIDEIYIALLTAAKADLALQRAIEGAPANERQ
jgi:hypothetical protein